MFMFAAVPMLSRQVTWLLMPRRREYPSACNAMETLRLHKDTLRNGVAVAPTILISLRAPGVKCLDGPCACYMKMGLADMASKELNTI
jgi:delta-1-pyrroline-5-carboxylate synthetase